MAYRSLGNSGLKVSTICLGTMTFGHHERPGNCSEELGHKILDRYAEIMAHFYPSCTYSYPVLSCLGIFVTVFNCIIILLGLLNLEGTSSTLQMFTLMETRSGSLARG